MAIVGPDCVADGVHGFDDGGGAELAGAPGFVGDGFVEADYEGGAAESVVDELKS